MVAVGAFQHAVPAPPPGQARVAWSIAGQPVLARIANGTTVLGFLPVVPMVLVSVLLMVVVSRLTAPPGPITLARYFAPDE